MCDGLGKETFLRPSNRPLEAPTHSALGGAVLGEGFPESCLLPALPTPCRLKVTHAGQVLSMVPEMEDSCLVISGA